VRAFRRNIKKHPTLNREVEETLRVLVKDPFASQLETHKLKGKLSGSWACSVGYGLRIIFDFIKREKQKKMIFSCLRLEHMMRYIEPGNELHLTELPRDLVRKN